MNKPTYIVEDPSKVPPEERYPKMTQVDVDLIREYIRKSNEGYPQFKGVWYRYKVAETNPQSIPYWRLEDEDGYAMIFNADVFRLDQCFEKFFTNKEEDPDWNYGKKRKINGKWMTLEEVEAMKEQESRVISKMTNGLLK